MSRIKWRPLPWCSLALLVLLPACKKAVEDPPPTEKSATDSTPTAQTMETTPRPFKEEDEVEEDVSADEEPTPPPFFLAQQRDDEKRYEVNVMLCDGTAMDDLGRKEDEYGNAVFIVPVGHASLHESLRRAKQFTVLFEDNTLSTHAVKHYEFSEDGGGTYCYAQLDGKTGKKTPVIAFAGKPTGKAPKLRKPKRVKPALSEADYNSFFDAFFALQLEQELMAPEEKPPREQETNLFDINGVHGSETVRVRFLDNLVDEDDVQDTGAGAVWVGKDGKLVAVVGSWGMGVSYDPLYWIDHDGDGVETLLLAAPYHEGLTVYAVDFDLVAGQILKTTLEDHGL